MWNHYQLTKLSPAIVANPRVERKQCLHPEGAVVWDVPVPSIWRNELSSQNDRFYDTILITEDPISTCWKYDDVYGNTHLHGMIYGYDLQWNNSLVLSRWDDYTNPDNCVST